MKALFLVIIVILAVAVGVQVYKNYATPVVPSVQQPQENNNQERPPLSFEGDVFPTELKTDPVTGDKIFEGLGVRMRIPSKGFVVTVATPVRTIYLETPEDIEIERKIEEEHNPKASYPFSYLKIEFEQNTDNLTWEEWLKKVGLYDSQ